MEPETEVIQLNINEVLKVKEMDVSKVQMLWQDGFYDWNN